MCNVMLEKIDTEVQRLKTAYADAIEQKNKQFDFSANYNRIQGILWVRNLILDGEIS